MNRIELIAIILTALGAITLMAMAFGIWPGNWSLFVAITLFIIANMLREYSKHSYRHRSLENQE